MKNACASAQPKIQKMITEEEDTDKIENLLTLNDMINNVMSKFADLKKGIFDTQYDISGMAPAAQTDSAEQPKQAISLIDLDDEPSATSEQPQQQQQVSSNPMNDLSDIFGSTSISSSNTASPQPNAVTKKPDIFDLLGGGTNISAPSTPPPPRSPQVMSSTPSPTLSQRSNVSSTTINTGKNQKERFFIH